MAGSDRKVVMYGRDAIWELVTKELFSGGWELGFRR